jgi:hypothetical protein
MISEVAISKPIRQGELAPRIMIIKTFCCGCAIEAQGAGTHAALNKTNQAVRFRARDVRRLMRGGRWRRMGVGGETFQRGGWGCRRGVGGRVGVGNKGKIQQKGPAELARGGPEARVRLAAA